MKVTIINDNCIGCGQCEATCDEVFQVQDDGIAHVVGKVTDKNNEDVKEAADGCPTDAIVIENA